MAKLKANFYVINPKKLFWLSVVTLGFYEIYWFYKNWQAIQEAEEEKISPFWRAVFTVIFVSPLFKKMAVHLKLEQFGKYTVERMASFYIAACLLGLGLNYLPTHPLVGLAAVATVFLTPLVLAYAQTTINEAYKETPESTLSSKEQLVAVAGVIFWILYLFGLFMPEA